MSEIKETQVQQEEHYARPSIDEIEPHLHARTYLVLFAVFMQSFAQNLLLTASGAFAPAVAQVIGGADKASWMVSAILLPMVALAVPVSQAADYWGRKVFLVGLTGLAFVGALITSRATSMPMAIAGQALIGPCFATTALVFAIVSEVLPHRHRMTAQAVPGLANGTGCVAGLLAPAALITKYGPTSFRVYWYICSAILALSTLICYFCYHPPARELQKSLTFREKLNRLDWTGGALLTLGLVALCIALFWAQNPYPWVSAQVLVPLCLSIALLAAFGLSETKYKTDGMLNHELFGRDWNVAYALAGMAFEGLIFIACNIFLPLQLTVVFGRTPILMGTNVAIGFITYIIASWCAAWYSYHYKGVRNVVIFGFSAFLIFDICMATATLKSGEAMWGYAIFFGLGLPCVLNGQVSLAQFSAPPELIATTSGLLAAFRGVGTCVGASIYAALFNAKISHYLPSEIAASVATFELPATSIPELIQDLASGNAQALGEIPSITPEVIVAASHGLQLAYLKSFRYLWITSAAFAAGGILMAFLFKDVTSDFSQKIDAPAESEEALYGDRIKQVSVNA